jgi:hypothetical protein
LSGGGGEDLCFVLVQLSLMPKGVSSLKSWMEARISLYGRNAKVLSINKWVADWDPCLLSPALLECSR